MRERDLRRHRQERRLTVTLFTTFVAFSICSIPPAVILIVGKSTKFNIFYHFHAQTSVYLVLQVI